MGPATGLRSLRGRPAARPSRRRLHAAAVALLGLVIWLLCAPPARAQAIYEWREPDGTATYGQVAPAGAHAGDVRQLRLADEAPPRRAAAARLQAAAQPATSADARALRRADDQVALAVRTLQRAEQALRGGQEPRPGERRHLVNGHSRLTQVYFDRVAALEAAVAEAREAMQTAYTERDTLLAVR